MSGRLRTLPLLGAACGVLIAVSACASGSSAGTAGALSSRTITERDLEAFPPELTVYDLLRQHTEIRVEGAGGDEVFQVADRAAWNMGTGGRHRAALIYLNNRREMAGVTSMRQILVSRVRRIEILTSTEASARFGGHGRTPIISIETR